MKKTFLLVLCLALLFSSIITVAEETTDEAEEEFTLTLTSVIKANTPNAKEWMKNDENRALSSICLIMDYVLSTSNEGIDPPFEIQLLSNPSYIGRKGFWIMTMILSSDNKQALFLACNTLSTEDTAFWFVVDVNSQIDAESRLKSVCSEGCYKNDVIDIYNAYTELMKAINQQP